MAAKRKGGLKLNAICAKLSRQVVFDSSSQNAEGEQSVAENSERGSSHYDDSETNFRESLSLSQSLEEDQKRREAIEKWVNGEYGDEPPAQEGADEQEHELRDADDEDAPPEGVYMVQPKGCSDEEDNNGEEAEPLPGSQDGSYHDDKDAEDGLSKPDAYMPPSEAPGRQAPFSSPGTFELSVLQSHCSAPLAVPFQTLHFRVLRGKGSNCRACARARKRERHCHMHISLSVPIIGERERETL